jgi:hypothetical protein
MGYLLLAITQNNRIITIIIIIIIIIIISYVCASLLFILELFEPIVTKTDIDRTSLHATSTSY